MKRARKRKEQRGHENDALRVENELLSDKEREKLKREAAGERSVRGALRGEHSKCCKKRREKKGDTVEVGAGEVRVQVSKTKHCYKRRSENDV